MKEKLVELKSKIKKAIETAEAIECWGVVSYLEDCLDNIEASLDELNEWIQENED